MTDMYGDNIYMPIYFPLIGAVIEGPLKNGSGTILYVTIYYRFMYRKASIYHVRIIICIYHFTLLKMSAIII